MSKALRQRFAETNNGRLSLRVHNENGQYEVWLGLDFDSLPEFIIGLGTSRVEALQDARILLSRAGDVLTDMIGDVVKGRVK